MRVGSLMQSSLRSVAAPGYQAAGNHTTKPLFIWHTRHIYPTMSNFQSTTLEITRSRCWGLTDVSHHDNHARAELVLGCARMGHHALHHSNHSNVVTYSPLDGRKNRTVRYLWINTAVVTHNCGSYSDVGQVITYFLCSSQLQALQMYLPKDI